MRTEEWRVLLIGHIPKKILVGYSILLIVLLNDWNAHAHL